jgi:hypothetical protein
LRAPQIWPGNTKAVSPGCLGVTAWRRRCELHRRTTGGWSQTGRELAIGDVVIAKSGDTCALHVGCRNAALKAEFSPSAPADSACERLDAMSMSRAIERDVCNGCRSRHERARRQMEFGHAQPSGDWPAGPQDLHQPLLSLVQVGDGRPCAQGEQKVLVNPRGVSQIDANTFLRTWTMSDCSLLLAPDRASKPPTSSSLAKKRVDSLRLALLAPLAEACAR